MRHTAAQAACTQLSMLYTQGTMTATQVPGCAHTPGNSPAAVAPTAPSYPLLPPTQRPLPRPCHRTTSMQGGRPDMRRPALSQLYHRLGDTALAARCPGDESSAAPRPRWNGQLLLCSKRQPPSEWSPIWASTRPGDMCRAWLPYSSLAAASVWPTATYQMVCWQPPAAGLRHATTQALALHANNETASWLPLVLVRGMCRHPTYSAST
jgi:hypothetical protein